MAKNCFQRGKRMVVGNGRRTRFWEDVWIRECTLKISFPCLFRLSNDQANAVANWGGICLSEEILGARENGTGTNTKYIRRVMLTDQKDKVFTDGLHLGLRLILERRIFGKIVSLFSTTKKHTIDLTAPDNKNTCPKNAVHLCLGQKCPYFNPRI